MSEALPKPDIHEIQVDDHITLRQITIEEAPLLFELVDNDRDYLGEYLPWVDHTTSVQDSEDFITQTIKKRQEGSEYGFGIIVDGEPAGHMSLMHLTDGQEPEIGYWIASRFSGLGITSKATIALIALGFDQLQLDKIVIKADPSNTGSNRIAEKVGGVFERQEHDPRISADKANVWALHKDSWEPPID